jgi:uncharacterized protein (TIGR00375 family)
LAEYSEGIFQSRENPTGAKFLLSAEISCIYVQGGKQRRIHILVFAPSMAAAGKISEELVKRGCNLSSDGRPIIGLTAEQLAEVVFSVEERCLVIPAHAWTPWFSLYGSKSGFDSIGEAFGKYAGRIYAVETGLSSDPAMNWRVMDLEKRTIMSFSDAHSGAKLGREATVFGFRKEITSNKSTDFSYDDIYWAIGERFLGKNKGKLEIVYTIEFYPEEGKYHYTGHRNCGVIQTPEETRKRGTICHVCGKPLTVGVMHRVEELAQTDLRPEKRKGKSGVTGYFNGSDKTRPGYVMLVPLLEIVAEVYGTGMGSKKAGEIYTQLTERFGNEFNLLLGTEPAEIEREGGKKLAEAVEKVREGSITIKPGYDGVFGTVKIGEETEEKDVEKKEQMVLF